MLIFGAVHVAQAVATFGKQLGFRVIVTDARAKLLTEDRFPMADELIQGWPEDAIAQVTIDRNTYVVILTHDPKFDEPALLGTLGSEARYIGAVGSRKTSADRRVRLTEAGATDEQMARIHGPIGLNIGASTPEEMAISILAEIIAVRHGRDAQPLTTATGNIRAQSLVVAECGGITGVILAAGFSRRLGRPKQLLDYQGKPLLQWAIDAALNANLDEVSGRPRRECPDDSSQARAWERA